jgi:hypothetical protein
MGRWIGFIASLRWCLRGWPGAPQGTFLSGAAGDERVDYIEALERHYAEGPRADWHSGFVTYLALRKVHFVHDVLRPRRPTLAARG